MEPKYEVYLVQIQKFKREVKKDFYLWDLYIEKGISTCPSRFLIGRLSASIVSAPDFVPDQQKSGPIGSKIGRKIGSKSALVEPMQK